MNKDMVVALLVMMSFIMGIFFVIDNSHKEKQGDKTFEGEAIAVYWHSGASYSVAEMIDGKLEINRLPVQGERNVDVFTDVPENKSIWYKCRWSWGPWAGQTNQYCELHIHNIDELNTSEYSCGKNCKNKAKRVD